jgi:TRAP-type C4-dicarboxylate transport system permease large subunit
MILSIGSSRLRMAFSTLPSLLILCVVVGYGTGELLHGQLLSLGEHLFGEYHLLRVDPQKPTCDPEALRPNPQNKPESQKDSIPSDDLIDDLLDDEKEQSHTDGSADDDLLDELLEDDKEPDNPDEFEDNDLLDDLLEDDKKPDPDSRPEQRSAQAYKHADTTQASQLALAAAFKNCVEKHERYSSTLSRISQPLRLYRTLEGLVASFVNFGVSQLRSFLALLFLLCAATTTASKNHIALRQPLSLLDHRISNIAQLGANGLLLYSAWSMWQVDLRSGITLDHPELYYIWMLGFLCMVLLNIFHLLKHTQTQGHASHIGYALLCIPLYSTMALISGVYFLVSEGHAAGLSIYLGKLTEHAILYLHVGLYVWVGMLLKQTRLAPLSFDCLRPWKLPPELLAFVAVVGAALPTAYSGASGIFVIAVGAVIYRELRRAGSRKQLALAATAMSGSMGVVLNPCLIVVIVASLNKEVRTDELYHWGSIVFMLTACLFLAASLLNRQGPLRIEKASLAWPECRRALTKLLPYLGIFIVLLGADTLILNAHLDEHSAPMLLPVILFFFLAYEKYFHRDTSQTLTQETSSTAPVKATTSIPNFASSVTTATEETSGHIGALLSLMGLSVCLGGIVERADLMSMIPSDFGSPLITMMVLVVVLVMVGMTMDPYGAVILVSATINEIAYKNGIHPVHFWMVVLVAFELGYLTPPVALNHLLTRQVVKDEADSTEEEPGLGFWSRHERLLLPVCVMGSALILVAFVPLFWL